MIASEMNSSDLPAPPYTAVLADESESPTKSPTNGVQELTIEERMQRLHARARSLEEREQALQRRENDPKLLQHEASTHHSAILASAALWLILLALAFTFFALNSNTSRAKIQYNPLAHAALIVLYLSVFSIFRFLGRIKVEESFKLYDPESRMFKATVYAWHVVVPLAVIPSVVLGTVIWIGLIENRWD